MKKFNENHFFEKFKWSNIFILNLKRAMLFIAIPLIAINILASVYYYKNLSLEYSVSSRQMLSSVENVVRNTLSGCEDVFNMISTERGLSALMRADKIEDLTGSRAEPVTKLRNILETQALYSDYISSIDVYSYKAQYVLSSHANGKIHQIRNKPWYNTSSDELCYMVNDADSFRICYNVVSNTTKLGLIIFTIDPSALEAAFMASPDKVCNLALYDRDGKRFYASSDELFAKDGFEFLDGDTKTIQKNKFTRIYSRVNDVGLSLIAEHTRPLYSQFVFMTILTIVLLFVLSFVFAYILSRQLYRSIQEIAVTLNDVNADNAPDRTTDEIAYINQNILSMKSKNQLLEQELVKSFVELKKMQTKTLQMQFTPHFLFNALNTLNASIMLKLGANNPESASIETIAEMLTASLDVNNYMVTVAEELSHCKKYVRIQSFISNNNFDIKWNIADDVHNLMTVKFSLQPLIENAFKHGIRHLQNKARGLLAISARTEGQNLIFEIENNGPVPDAKTIAEVNAMLRDPGASSQSHVGLFNVNKRINLIFGESYGCSMDVQNNLTVLRVTLPITTDTDVFKD